MFVTLRQDNTFLNSTPTCGADCWFARDFWPLTGIGEQVTNSGRVLHLPDYISCQRKYWMSVVLYLEWWCSYILTYIFSAEFYWKSRKQGDSGSRVVFSCGYPMMSAWCEEVNSTSLCTQSVFCTILAPKPKCHEYSHSRWSKAFLVCSDNSAHWVGRSG